MNKITSFFIGILLLAITMSTVFIAVLTYRANEQTSVETYIFQMGARPNKRVGPLQSLADLKTDGLRNKMIQKYVSEYFKVIPGDVTVEQKAIIGNLSNSKVYSNWLNGEAKNIETMAQDKMFRNVWVDVTQIQSIKDGWWAVPYFTRTWTESNKMNADIIYNAGIINLRIRFLPGIRPEANVRKYLEDGGDPAGLFMFQVIDVAM